MPAEESRTMITADDQEFAVSCMLAALEPLADRESSQSGQ
jgi:hypothetical protein